MAEAALRLTFEYDGSGIRIIERDEIAKDLPESDNIVSSSTTGFFIELRAADDSLVYQRFLGVYLGTRSEGLNANDEAILIEHDSVVPGAFDTIVPDLPAAQDVVLLASRDRMSSQMAQILGVGAGPAQIVLRTALREDGGGIV